ncbi:MAG: Uma2 family endonuclease [Chitinophagales bacterium]|nr:Uma2 family endonuclease [Chitinophagales bacterium]
MSYTVNRSYASHYTINDWENWKDKWELIDGVPYAMSPAPSPYHQRVNDNILAELRRVLKSCKQCRQYMPIDWVIDDDTIVEPDVLVVCKEIKGKHLDFAPELIFEILSPSTAEKDREVKSVLYFEQKVKYYVIVDAKKLTAEIFVWNKTGYAKTIAVQNSKFTFQLSHCLINFNFKNIWD